MKALAALVLFTSALAFASNREAAPAPQSAPGLQGAFREFDFWVGEWDVHDPAGQLVGRNSITLVEHGGAIQEKWESAGGGTGTSLSYYDRLDERWYQVWVTAQAGADVAVGGLQGEAMVLVGHDAKGRVTTRTAWTPLEDGRVRQHWEQTGDGGETWSTVFDGYYSRRAEPVQSER